MDRPASPSAVPIETGATEALRADSIGQAPARSSNTTTEANPHSSPPQKSQWTLALDLTTTQDGADGGGALNQSKRIQALVSETRNSSVSFVVQVTEPPPANQPHLKAKESEANTIKKGPIQPSNVERFLIQNGTVTSISDSAASRGMANDVEDLLRTANQVAPSEHIGLVMQSHGGAADGLESDAGKATLPEFTHAVTDGLADSNHAKLDLLDFDACSMANLNVAEAMAPIAEHMVASSEVETSEKHSAYDAQNLQLTLHNLIQNPNWSASDLAKSMISQADAGANDGLNSVTHEIASGTVTLAHFDLSHLPEFNDRLNTLGQTLTKSLNDPAQKRTVNDAIQSSPLLPRDGMELAGNPRETRDLESFANNIMKAAQEGKLTNPEVLQAAEGILSAEHQLIPEHHNSVKDGYGNQGGMTAFLPDLRLLDTSNTEGAGNDELSQINFSAEPNNDYMRNYEHKGRAASSISRSIDNLTALVGTNHSDDIQQLRSDLAAVTNAGDSTRYTQALDALHADTQRLLKSSLEADLMRVRNERTRDRQIDEQSVPITGWQQFLNELKTANS